jgi:hypothetical protein
VRLPGAGREHCFIRALIVLPQAAVITTLDEQVKILQGQVEADFGRHPDRYASGKARKNYAATSPVTRASGNSAGPAVRG